MRVPKDIINIVQRLVCYDMIVKCNKRYYLLFRIIYDKNDKDDEDIGAITSTANRGFYINYRFYKSYDNIYLRKDIRSFITHQIQGQIPDNY